MVLAVLFTVAFAIGLVVVAWAGVVQQRSEVLEPALPEIPAVDPAPIPEPELAA